MARKTGEKGEKFTERYGVESLTGYKGDSEALQIPPPGHPLYDPTAPTVADPLKVAIIDADGTMTDPIEVWTDPDLGIMWVVDGRDRLLAVREVNRVRLEKGLALVKPSIIPFKGDEKEAVARIRIKNYHRRVPKLSATGIDIKILRDKGHSWEDCAKILHVVTDDAEQWCRKRLPLAFCADEVREAFDSGEFPLARAVKFGGGAVDGDKKLGKQGQLALLAEMRSTKAQSAGAPRLAVVGAKARERLREAFGSIAAPNEKVPHSAQIVRATLARIDGDTRAFKDFPEIEGIFEEILKPKKAGRPKKAPAEKTEKKQRQKKVAA